MLWYSIIVTFFSLIILTAFCLLLYREGYVTKIFVKLGWIENRAKINWTAFSWNNMLEKLNYKADVVFFGDSIIRGSDFQKTFPNKRIVNLGCSGDTLAGMSERVNMIKALNPKQIFILAGINGLTDKNIEMSIKTYEGMLDKIKENNPDSKIYVHSVLPLSELKEKTICKNKTIKLFNEKISVLAYKKDIMFIDIYSIYEKNGVLNPELTVDGIHLHPYAYDNWANVLKKYII